MLVARRPGGARAGALAAALACLLLARLALGTGPAGLVLDAAVALAAAVGTLDAARRAVPGRSRLAWRFETAAVLVWLLAPLAWLTGLPEAVAAFGRGGLVVGFAVAWWLTSLATDTWSRLRLLVDGALAGAAVFVVAWSGLLEHVAEGAGTELAGRLAITLPLAAVAVATQVVGVTLTEIPRSRRAMPWLVVAGLLVVAGSDVARGLDRTPLWAVAFGCIAVATRLYRGTSRRREMPSTRARLVYAPYVLLLPAVVTVAVQYAGDGVPEGTATTGVAMGVLLLVRQHATLLENRHLVARLEATEQRLRYRAMHDSLTGLGGRALLHQRLDAAVERHRRHGVPLAVAFIDLDDFKLVNDTHGHAAGDAVLVEIARRLRQALEPLGDAATAFRMSGDEFAVLLTGAAAEHPGEVGLDLLRAVVAPVRTGDDAVTVGGSVGFAVADGPSTESSALLRAADVAMYEVKHRGKGGVGIADRTGDGGR